MRMKGIFATGSSLNLPLAHTNRARRDPKVEPTKLPFRPVHIHITSRAVSRTRHRLSAVDATYLMPIDSREHPKIISPPCCFAQANAANCAAPTRGRDDIAPLAGHPLRKMRFDRFLQLPPCRHK